MVQTRGQQNGDQSPPGCGTLWGVTAEGDVVATTVSSGNTLKHAVSAHSAEHIATVPRGMCAGQEGLVFLAGTGSSTQAGVSVRENGRECVDGVNVPRGISAHPLGAVPHAGDSAGVTDSLRETGGCSGMEGAVSGVTSSANNTPCSAPPCRHPFWPANSLQGSGQWRGDCEYRFAQLCVQPVCLLQFMLGQCQLGHITPAQFLQRTREKCSCSHG